MVNSRPRLCLSKKSSWVDPTRCRHQSANAEAQHVKIWSKQVRVGLGNDSLIVAPSKMGDLVMFTLGISVVWV